MICYANLKRHLADRYRYRTHIAYHHPDMVGMWTIQQAHLLMTGRTYSATIPASATLSGMIESFIPSCHILANAIAEANEPPLELSDTPTVPEGN